MSEPTKSKGFTGFIWDYEANTIRGSFINVFLTILYVLIIIACIIFPVISKNIREVESFLIGFYAVSFGVWSGRKVIENVSSKNYMRSLSGIPGINSILGSSTETVSKGGTTTTTTTEVNREVAGKPSGGKIPDVE